MITIEWMDGFPCIRLPTGVVLLSDVTRIRPIKPKHQRGFSKLQQIKEDKCYKDLLRELKKRFKDNKK
jgi:hypothetical protein